MRYLSAIVIFSLIIFFMSGYNKTPDLGVSIETNSMDNIVYVDVHLTGEDIDFIDSSILYQDGVVTEFFTSDLVSDLVDTVIRHSTYPTTFEVSCFRRGELIISAKSLLF